MGNTYYYAPPIRKRNDYDIEEIEKKYTDEELSKLILYNYVENYPSLIYHPEIICKNCRKNKIDIKLQLSDFYICDNCYQEEKKENYDEMIKIFQEDFIVYDGDWIVEDKLILGNIKTSYLKDKLKSLGVTHILMIGYYMTPIFPDDFEYGNFEINDEKNENIMQYLIEGIKFIEKDGVCYCHCQWGKSRSASFAIAYVMYKKKLHFSDAFDFVKMKRRICFPNEGFQCQLEDFDIILSNFDYDLDKCDEFIKKFMKERDELKVKEKEYLMKKKKEKLRINILNYPDSDSDTESENKNKEISENNNTK